MSELGKYQLPKGWSWATIPDLAGKAGVFIDGDWVESKDQDPGGDVRLIQLADVGDGVYRDKSDRFMTKAKADELGCTFLKDGDVLIARMPDPLGRACLFPGDAKPSVTVVDVAIVRSGNGEFDHRWLACFVNAHPFRSAISGLQAGSTRKRISRGNLATIPVPVPPLLEQRRIVSEVEKQFTRLEAGVSALRRVQANIKRYRAAVLKAACEGRLTADERKEKTTDDNRRAKDLPDGWETAPLSRFIESSFYGPRFSKESYASEGVPTIRTTDIAFDGSIILADAPRIKLSPDEIEKYRLLQGDIVVTRTGATIGKCAIYDESRGPAIPSAYLIRFRFKKDLLDPKYILRFLMSSVGQSLLVGGSTAVAQPNVNATTISKFMIPVPPLAEQTWIVAEVERRLSVVEELEAVVTSNLQRATRLRQSILQKAFTGQLSSADQLPTGEAGATISSTEPQHLHEASL